ncbi:hypothetical protein TNCV_478431 [Trichonephila clavipes]|nr:hypothetical protein TNCV_478431 [Trichonephila clavipes]
MNINNRWNFVKKSKLCFNCLRGNHNVSSCKLTTSCRACKQRHHTVLHQFQSSPREIPVSNSNQNLAATSDQNVVQPLATSQEQFCLAGQMNYSNSILLSTAIVRVKNSQGHFNSLRLRAKTACFWLHAITASLTVRCPQRYVHGDLRRI